jgi:alkylhydroperoxidase family enzyme
MREALAAIRPAEPRLPFPKTEGRPKGLNILGTFAHHPALAKAYNTFNGHILFATTLEARQRELLVLRVASRRSSAYEWAQHAVLAGDVGLTGDDLARVVDGPDAEGWSPLDAALLRAVDELLDDAAIGDRTWDALAADLDPQQVLDVIFTVGAYDVLAMLMRSVGLPLDADLRPD